jgi:hypothetical protein
VSVLVFSFILVSVPFFSFAQVSTTQTKEKTKSSPKTQTLTYPYTAEYSSNFTVGNPNHAKLVLDIWKAWDDNAIDRYADQYADTITGTFPDGTVLKGKEAYLSASRKMRSTFSTVKSSVEAWMPLLSNDRKENWVAVWGREEDTDKSGQTQTTMIHEIWRINRDGKIDYYQQYASKMPKNN